MIITRLIGGLGNQMFQYALGRAMSLKWHSDLYLDLTFLMNPPPNTTPRDYGLDRFNIKAAIAPMDLLKQVPLSRKDRFCKEFQSFFLRRPVFEYVKEQTIDFDSRIPDLPDNVYLDGYWQSEKYFKDIEKIIHHEFCIKIPPDPLNKKIGDQILHEESVSIHVRRGDYVENPQTTQVHGVCDETYFQKATEVITNKIQNPHFFVFSDDPEWAKRNITVNAPIDFVTHNDASKNYEDLRLMGLCKHHIIANSSFSWWGAWLGKKKGQIVIAPNRWYNIKKYNVTDRFPSDWLII